MSGSGMYELVRVGRDKLVGEIIKLIDDTASIQVNSLALANCSLSVLQCYEETGSSALRFTRTCIQLTF